MSNIVSMGQSREFLLSRAARHRRAGRYDEAMTLLSKARAQCGPEIDEEIELETARVYDEMGCDEEAARSYLRVVRVRGVRRGQALFHLALSCAQRADIRRAVSYYQLFLEENKCSCAKDPDAISQDMAALLGKQLREEIERPVPSSRRAYVKALERRAAERLQEGKARAAQCAMMHATALYPNAQGFTLLACCCLMRSEYRDAVTYARVAHELSPGRVQTLCVLADAQAAAGKMGETRRTLYLAAMRARDTEDKLAAALESAKHGEDGLTMILTRAILRREPYHTRAMFLRGCALVNLGRMKEASRLFGRLCVLLPENTVCEACFRLAKAGRQPGERLSLGMDVTREEGVARAGELMKYLYQESDLTDRDEIRRAVRLCGWAIRSLMVGTHIRTAALIVLSKIDDVSSREALKDALMDAQMADSVKMAILQMLTAKYGFYPYEVDMDGRLVRLAAGGVSAQPHRGTAANQKIVQRAADVLSPDYPDAARMMLPLFMRYLEIYPTPKKQHESACAAALEYVYHWAFGRKVNMDTIAQRCGAPKRLCIVIAKRLMLLVQKENQAFETHLHSGELQEQESEE